MGSEKTLREDLKKLEHEYIKVYKSGTFENHPK